jgi:hypothetical protein
MHSDSTGMAQGLLLTVSEALSFTDIEQDHPELKRIRVRGSL